MIINEKIYREVRCPNCRKLICYEYVYAGRIGFVCPRCDNYSELIFKHLKTIENEDNINKDFTIKPKKKGGEL